MGEADMADDDALGPIARNQFAASPMEQPGDTADRVAGMVASWTFPLAVLVAISVWLGVNLTIGRIEPFPTVMLATISAVLATLSALQAPVILRVQRRQRQRDRARDQIDHRINIRAELEIRWLDHKLDHLLMLHPRPHSEGGDTTASAQHD